MRKFLSKNSSQITISVVIILASALCIFTPESGILQRSADFTVHIMLSLLLLGMFFLIFDQKRLMFLSLVACVFLNLFLKQASNSHLLLPNKNTEPNISIAHINVSSPDVPADELMDILLHTNADIISFQEVTPDWEIILKRYLSEKYPYRNSLVRIDPYGMAFFSILPIKKVDTLFYNHVPNLVASFDVNHEKEISLISTYLIPPLYKTAGLATKEHLYMLARRIKTFRGPVLSLGDFNMTYWSNEIRNFRNEAGLENSRRNISLSSLKIPYEHIFYSPELECTQFKEIRDKKMNYIGIMGAYQFKNLETVSDKELSTGLIWN